MKPSLYLLFLIIVLFSFSNTFALNVFKLTQERITVDTGICHLNIPSNFTVAIYFQSDTPTFKKHYRVSVFFGDGSSQILIDSSVASSTTKYKTFTNTYTSPGNKTVRIYLYEGLNATPIDSAIRSYDVGACTPFSGMINYDAKPNCTYDDGEAPFAGNQFGFINKGIWIGYPVKDGYFNIPIFPSDSIVVPNGSVEPAFSRLDCPHSQLLAGTKNYRILLSLIENAWIEKITPSDTNACINHLVQFGFDVRFPHNGNFTLDGLVLNGGGYIAPSWVPTKLGSDTFVATLTNRVYGIAIMKKRVPVHVAHCDTVLVKLYTDLNGNCRKDADEPLINNASIRFSPKKRKGHTAVPYNFHTDTLRKDKILVYPDDTIAVDTATYPWPFAAPMRYVKNCGRKYITGNNSTEYLGFRQTTKFYSFDTERKVCKNDTMDMQLNTFSIFYPANTKLLLISKYGDGAIDTTFTYTDDTVQWHLRHRYNASGTFQATFIIADYYGYKDSVTQSVTIDDCTLVSIRAFIDSNRNCIQDAGELISKLFYMNAYGSDPDRVIKYSVYAPQPIPSIRDAYSNITYTPANVLPYCSWPLLTQADTAYNIPLVENYAFNIAPFLYSTGIGCDRFYYNCTLNINVTGNYFPRPTYAMLYFGDGSSAHYSMGYVNNNSFSFIFNHRYVQAGTYTPTVAIIDSISRKVLHTYTFPSSLTIADTCYNVRGNIFTDINGNCIRDNGENGCANILVSIYNKNNGLVKTTTTNSAGDYSVQLDTLQGIATQYTIQVPQVSNEGMPIGNCNPYKKIIQLRNKEIINFTYQCTTTGNVGISMAGRPLQAGTIDTLYIFPANHACANDSAKIVMQLDGNVSFVSSTVPYTAAGQAIQYHFGNFSSAQVIKIAISVSATATGQICNTATLTPYFSDPDNTNNSVTICNDLVQNANTNIKTVDAVDMRNDGSVTGNKELIYTIYFTNNTSADAPNVSITDSLDANLDITTFHVINSSHPVAITMKNRTAHFDFASAYLPAGINNSNPGTGFIQYGIMPKNNLTNNTIIANQANIVMGLLPDFATNTTQTRVGLPAFVEEGIQTEDIKLYPNPAHNLFTVHISEAMYETPITMQVLQLDGKERGHYTLTTGANHIDIAGWIPGLYIVHIKTATGNYFNKIVVQ